MSTVRRRRRPAEVRDLLVEAAGSVFREKPYGEATTEEIAARAGVARSVLYRHFDGKAELFRLAVLMPFVDVLRDYSVVLNAPAGPRLPDEELLRTMVSLFYDSFEEHRDSILTLALTADDLDPEASAHLDDELDRFFGQLLAVSDLEAMRRDWKTIEGLDLTIRLMLGSIAGMTVLSRIFTPRRTHVVTRDEAIAHITRLTLNGLTQFAPTS